MTRRCLSRAYFARLSCVVCAAAGERVASTSALVSRLRSLGYRVTGPRRTIVDLVAAQRRQFTAGDLCRELATLAPSVGRATIFRTLDLLASAGLISRAAGEDGSHTYTVCVDCQAGHHHHLVCSRCGLVVALEECPLGDQWPALAARSQFRVDGHRLEFFGLCAACAQQAGAAG